MQQINHKHNDYLITSNKAKADVIAIHKWLSEESYWKKDIAFDVIKDAVENSFCINILFNDEQIGFGRLITDYTTFAYLADVYIVEKHRKKGLSKVMIELMLGLDWVKALRKIMLATLDAQTLYTQYGFVPINNPERFMEFSPITTFDNDQNNM